MRRDDAGFALVEAMIGAAIVAISLAAMYAAIYESASRNRMAEQRRTAMMIAQSELAAVGSIIPAAPGTTEGMEGDYYWRVDIQPFGADTQQSGFGTPPNPVGILCIVKVTVADQRRAPLANLTSLTLARGT
jgi:type II secretory pathway pseudopilin PulG